MDTGNSAAKAWGTERCEVEDVYWGWGAYLKYFQQDKFKNKREHKKPTDQYPLETDKKYYLILTNQIQKRILKALYTITARICPRNKE